MKKTILLSALLSLVLITDAQSVGDRAKTSAKQKTNARVNRTIDSGIDSTLNKTGRAISSIFKKKDKKKKDADTVATKATTAVTSTTSSSDAAITTTPAITGGADGAYGDFVPGANIIFEEYFAKDALLDFPAQWNTNGSGKLVNITGQQGKWLDIAHNSVVNPVLNKALPENCTIGFDLFLMTQGSQLTPFIQFGLTEVSDLLKEDIYRKQKFFVNITRYSEKNGQAVEYGLQQQVIGNKNDFPLVSYTNKVLHIDMAINKTRIRVYADKQKLIDLPRALAPAMRNNFYVSSVMMVPAPAIDVLVGNIRIASADTDARSLLIKQLLEEGKAVTNDILFDVDSDVIKPESYSIIDQFGSALQSDASLKIKITGHTDSDGSASHNLDLSKKRAVSVKNYLLTHFSIDASRIQSDGKGAAQPVAANTTEAGKAKNRRVEFVKL